MTANSPPFVGKGVAADLEKPDAEAAVRWLALLTESRQTVQRSEENLSGQVFSGTSVAKLVESEVVHLSNILPIKRLEGARIAASRFYGGAVDVEVDQDRGTVLPSPQHRRSLSVTGRSKLQGLSDATADDFAAVDPHCAPVALDQERT